ncbi:MAG: hypothetical protein SCARUB_04163, partial [Candidatus Scalindua rubra]
TISGQKSKEIVDLETKKWGLHQIWTIFILVKQERGKE